MGFFYLEDQTSVLNVSKFATRGNKQSPATHTKKQAVKNLNLNCAIQFVIKISLLYCNICKPDLCDSKQLNEKVY